MGALRFLLLFPLALLLSVKAAGQKDSGANSHPAIHEPASDPPRFRVTFERGEAVSGVNPSPVQRLPLDCTSDGTVFVNFVNAVPAALGVPPPPTQPPSLLTSVSFDGQSHTFPLDPIPGLFVSFEYSHYAFDSGVAFLVRAASESKPVKRTVEVDGVPREYTWNAAEAHSYILVFDRDGLYKKSVRVDDTFRVRNAGVFPTGMFLVFGFDMVDHSSKLAMLKEDGSLFETIPIAKGDAPEADTSHGKERPPAVDTPSQMVPSGHKIFLVQSGAGFPLLEVSEGGALRAMRPRLPGARLIESLIPSDRNLYAVAASAPGGKTDEATVYELSPEDGTVIRQFDLGERHWASDVGCIHESKFLSFDNADGKMIPLTGTAEPASESSNGK